MPAEPTMPIVGFYFPSANLSVIESFGSILKKQPIPGIDCAAVLKTGSNLGATAGWFSGAV